MHTTAFWLQFATEFFDDFGDLSKSELHDSLHAAGTVLKTAATVLLLNDPRDLAVAVLDEPGLVPDGFRPKIVLYDNYPGGIGQSQPLFRRRKELIRVALELAVGCPCEAGCPSCVGPQNEIGPRGKEGALRILRNAGYFCCDLSASSGNTAYPVGAG